MVSWNFCRRGPMSRLGPLASVFSLFCRYSATSAGLPRGSGIDVSRFAVVRTENPFPTRHELSKHVPLPSRMQRAYLVLVTARQQRGDEGALQTARIVAAMKHMRLSKVPPW